MGDTACDADHLHQAIAAKGALAVIITNDPFAGLQLSARRISLCLAPSRGVLVQQAQAIPSRGTRFEKTARNHRAVVTVAAIVLWTR